MKQSATFLLFLTTLASFAQCNLFPTSSELSMGQNDIECKSFYSIPFYGESVAYMSHSSSTSENIDLRSSSQPVRHFVIPSVPVLTTKSNLLEVCEGNTTTLTAESDYSIEWYTSYPPEGEPVGKGGTFVTPKLTQGYSVYYAISTNNGIKSVGSEMEVVMVYPLPIINVVSSSDMICVGEKVSLKAFGTRFYEWNSGETSHEVIVHPERTTKYKVTGINTAGCKNTFEFTQNVQDCRLADETANKEVKETVLKSSALENNLVSTSFPNPNTGEFQVKLNQLTTTTRIELYNAYGELVFRTNALSEFTNINLTNAYNGIYTLRILDDSKLLKQEKVIIQK